LEPDLYLSLCHVDSQGQLLSQLQRGMVHPRIEGRLQHRTLRRCGLSPPSLLGLLSAHLVVLCLLLLSVLLLLLLVELRAATLFTCGRMNVMEEKLHGLVLLLLLLLL